MLAARSSSPCNPRHGGGQEFVAEPRRLVMGDFLTDPLPGLPPPGLADQVGADVPGQGGAAGAPVPSPFRRARRRRDRRPVSAGAPAGSRVLQPVARTKKMHVSSGVNTP
jgi:hypothetical protein